MKTLEISSCRSCPFVLCNEVTGYDGCFLSDEITDMYILNGQMPEIGIHDLCPIKSEGEIKVIVK